MQNIKDKAKEVGHAISEKATEVGHKVSETAEKVGDWAKEKMHAAGNRIDEAKQKFSNKTDELTGNEGCPGEHAAVREHMDVIASCGKKIGVVDHVEGGSIKLTKNDSPDGKHHLIPRSWIDHVDNHVHLTKDHAEAQREWQTL